MENASGPDIRDASVSGPEKSFVIDVSNRDTRKGVATQYYIWIEEDSHVNLPLGLSFNDNMNGEPNRTPR